MKSIWKRNDIQFPRLLAEIQAFGLTKTQYAQLRSEMDLTDDQINDIFERAEFEWRKIIARLRSKLSGDSPCLKAGEGFRAEGGFVKGGSRK